MQKMCNVSEESIRNYSGFTLIMLHVQLYETSLFLRLFIVKTEEESTFLKYGESDWHCPKLISNNITVTYTTAYHNLATVRTFSSLSGLLTISNGALELGIRFSPICSKVTTVQW
jgi:hypothetical protein